MVIEKHPLTNEQFNFHFEVDDNQIYSLKVNDTEIIACYDPKQLAVRNNPIFKMTSQFDREMYLSVDEIKPNTFKDICMLYVGLFEGHGIAINDRVFFFKRLYTVNNLINVVRF